MFGGSLYLPQKENMDGGNADMTEKTQELKPCPFCGSNRIFVATHEFDESPDYYKVECNECESETGFKLSKHAAIAAWNRRSNSE